MQWTTATAEYGSPDHSKYMRDKFEPFAIIPMSAGVNQITRQPEVMFMVFMKKQIPLDSSVPEPTIEVKKGILL